MFDRPMTMHYKAVLDVYLPEEASSREAPELFIRLVNIVQAYLNAMGFMDINRQYLENYGLFASADDRRKVSVASYRPSEPEGLPFVWAVKLIHHDDENRYRTWFTHIGINQDNDEHLRLFFAQLYADSLSDRISDIRLPNRQTPMFIEMLLRSHEINCCNGNYIIPAEAIKMTLEDIPIFTDMLFDSGRTIPVILHACPDLIEPNGLFSRLKGNAVLYYTSDFGVLDEANQYLPDHLQVCQDFIWIYLPMYEGELRPPLSIDARYINEKGARRIVDTVGRAYSECLRSDERNAFVSADFIHELRTTKKMMELENSHQRTQAQIKSLVTQSTRLEKERDAARDVLDSMKAHGILEYEELLSSCMQELDSTKETLKGLVDRLYLDMGKNFLPQNHESTLMNELEKALFACFSVRR